MEVGDKAKGKATMISILKRLSKRSYLASQSWALKEAIKLLESNCIATDYELQSKELAEYKKKFGVKKKCLNCGSAFYTKETTAYCSKKCRD